MSGAGELPDTLGAVEDDARAVLAFVEGSRPQDRARAYVVRRDVPRGTGATILERAGLDLVARAYRVGVRDGAALASVPAPPPTLAGALRAWWGGRRG